MPISDELAVQQVLAHYVRAHDRRDGPAMAALFTLEGRVEIVYDDGCETWPMGELVGRQQIASAVTQMMTPHPPLGGSHNATSALLVELDGDCATVDAQFMVFSVLGRPRPATGWPKTASGAQGTITPIESGYYRQQLVRIEGQWLIAHLLITGRLPTAF